MAGAWDELMECLFGTTSIITYAVSYSYDLFVCVCLSCMSVTVHVYLCVSVCMSRCVHNNIVSVRSFCVLCVPYRILSTITMASALKLIVIQNFIVY